MKTQRLYEKKFLRSTHGGAVPTIRNFLRILLGSVPLRFLLLGTFALTLQARVAASFPTNGLLAYYPLDANAKDLGPRANHGTEVNLLPTTNRLGKANRALLFENSRSRSIVLPRTVKPNYPLTIAFWANGTGTVITTDAVNSDGNRLGIHVTLSSNVWVTSYSGPASESTRYAESSIGHEPLDDGSWHHVAVVLTAYNRIKWFIDGVETETGNPTGSGGAVRYSSGGAGQIGAASPDNLFFLGALDNLVVYTRALGADEIPLIQGHEIVQVGAPTQQQVPEGATINLSTSVIGEGPLQYQWFYEDRPLRDSAGAIEGSNTPNLKLIGIRERDSGNYALEVSDGAFTVRGPSGWISAGPFVLATFRAIEVEFRTAPGAFYRLEGSTALPHWVPLAGHERFPGTGQLMTRTVRTEARQIFIRATEVE